MKNKSKEDKGKEKRRLKVEVLGIKNNGLNFKFLVPGDYYFYFTFILFSTKGNWCAGIINLFCPAKYNIKLITSENKIRAEGKINYRSNLGKSGIVFCILFSFSTFILFYEFLVFLMFIFIFLLSQGFMPRENNWKKNDSVRYFGGCKIPVGRYFLFSWFAVFCNLLCLANNKNTSVNNPRLSPQRLIFFIFNIYFLIISFHIILFF